jgi:anti-sigma factor RsiW
MTPVPPDRGELFSAYLDGELQGDEIEEVSPLLSDDTDAIEEFRDLQRIRFMLRRLPEQEMPIWLLHDSHSADRLSAYLDGELTSEENRDVAEHVLACRECRSDLQEFDRARIAIRALPGVDAPEGLFPDASPVVVGGRRRVGTLTAVAFGAAALLALFFGLVRNTAEDPVFTIEDLGSYHVARASAEPGFSVLPVLFESASP